MNNLEKDKLKLLPELIAVGRLTNLNITGNFPQEIYLKRDIHPYWRQGYKTKGESYLENHKNLKKRGGC